MEVGGSLSISYGPMSVEGSGRYLDDTLSSSKKMNLIYRCRHNAFFNRLKLGSLQMNDYNQKKYAGKNDELIEDLGTKFVSTIIYGAQLDIVFTVTSEDHIDRNEIE